MKLPHSLPFLTLLATTPLIHATPTPNPNPASLSASTTSAKPNITATKVYDLPLGVWAENLNTRTNGQVLLAIASQPDLLQINPSGNQDGTLIHRFYGSTSVFAIVELTKDLFYASVGNFSLTNFRGTKGSWNIWEIDLRNVGTNEQISECQVQPAASSSTLPCATPTVRLAASLPSATFIDGLAVLDAANGVLVTGDADSSNGQVYTVNVHTGKVVPTYANKALSFNTSAGDLLGVDGIKYVNKTFYFTNPSQGTFGKVPLSPTTGKATGPLSIVYNLTSTQGIDDFQFDNFGNLYASDVAGGFQYAKHPVGSGNLTNYAPYIPGPTATFFGKGAGQLSTLFVSDNGGFFQYLEGNVTSPGGLWAADVSALMK